MVKKGIILFALIIMISFGLIIYIPVAILSVTISTYDTINYSEPFTFRSSSPSPIEELNLNIDVGNITINYVDPNVDYHVKIDVNIEISGANLKGMNYSHFFNIIWHTTNSSAHLTLELLSDNWFDDSLWVERNVDIIVTIRSDVVFDIITNLGEGNFDITVPWAVSTGNLLTNISNGNISYDFKYCTIEGNLIGNVNQGDIFYNLNHCSIDGNITGIINEGNIEFITLNVAYTYNNKWNFNITSGNFDIDIRQDEDLGANITGLVRITNGEVYISYHDNSPDVGAILKIPYGNGFIDADGLPSCITSIWGDLMECMELEGFNTTYYITPLVEGFVFMVSHDLSVNLVKYYYYITFEILEGSFGMTLNSKPKIFERDGALIELPDEFDIY